MAQVLATDYSSAKTKVTNALNKVSRSWSWTNTVTSGTQAKAAQVKELQSALDAAHNKLVTGVANQCSANRTSNHANNSHSTCSSHHGSYNDTLLWLCWMN